MMEKGFYELAPSAAGFPDIPPYTACGQLRHAPLHWHNEVEILCPIIGSLTVAIGGQRRQLAPGDVFFVNSRLPHELYSAHAGGLHLIFRAERKAFYGPDDWTVAFPESMDEGERRELRRNMILNSKFCHEEMSQNPVSADRWYENRIAVYNILRTASRYAVKTKVKSGVDWPEVVSKCVEIINRRFSEPLSAKLLADETGVGESTIYHLFSKTVSMTLSEYINGTRISAACAMLDSGEVSIAQVAQHCGFGSLSNFYRVFQKHTNMSPAEYKAQTKPENAGKQGSADFQKLLAASSVQGFNRWRDFDQLPYDWEEVFAVNDRI